MLWANFVWLYQLNGFFSHFVNIFKTIIGFWLPSGEDLVWDEVFCLCCRINFRIKMICVSRSDHFTVFWAISDQVEIFHGDLLISSWACPHVWDGIDDVALKVWFLVWSRFQMTINCESGDPFPNYTWFIQAFSRPLTSNFWVNSYQVGCQ